MRFKFYRNISFSLLAVIILVMVAATIVERYQGTDYVLAHIYTSWWMIALWGLLVAFGGVYLWKRRPRPAVMLLHVSLVLILLGAMVTHCCGTKEQLHLRLGQSSHGVTLSSFRVVNYPGTQSPMDYVSTVRMDNGDSATVSMNHILRYRGYRFYQMAYDPDEKGTILQVSHDPWGIGITYTAYALMLLSFLWLLWQRGKKIGGSAVAVFLLLTSASASAAPQVLQPGLARSYGETYTYYNERVCPMNTRAVDFTTKLCGRASYGDYSADQVLTGFLFYYDDWKNEPIIKVKGDAVKRALGIKGRYARLTDFYKGRDYRLQPLLERHDKNAIAADEKVQLISMAVTGTLYEDDYLFSMEGVNQAAGNIYQGKNVAANELFHELSRWQRKKLGKDAPSKRHFEAELFYNKLHFTRPLAMCLTTLGLVLFLLTFVGRMGRVREHRIYKLLLIAVGVVLFAYLAGIFGLRWYVSGHLPLASGYEVMQFMSLLVVGYGLFTRMRQPYIVFLLAGLTLMVSMMGEANPQVTNLMPVLQSPLLSLHVCVIMLAYCLLAIQALQSLTWFLRKGEMGSRSAQADMYYLLWAVALLAIGIFLGAVWANVSWGTYWNWDPKEVWALITLLIYALPMHQDSIKWFKNPKIYHSYLIFAFLSVLFTYFGVNFLLGGMHSYA